MIINKINHKKYIGKSIDIEKRIQNHKTASDNMPIHKAIKKYGVENFIFEIIEECDESILDDREVYWINYYNTYAGYGYNATPGGEGASHPVKLTEQHIDDIINDLQQRHYSVSYVTVKDWCKQYGLSTLRKDYGYIDKQLYHSIPIIQCEKNTGRPIKQFNSITQAAKEMHVKTNAIRNALDNPQRSCCGYKWMRQ